jgi:hypothetical protein
MQIQVGILTTVVLLLLLVVNKLLMFAGLVTDTKTQNIITLATLSA